MEPCSGGSQTLNPESVKLFEEGISLVFSQWTALQMAVQNQWGGRDSLKKSHDLASEVSFWFTQSNGQLYIDDLERILDEGMVVMFNTEIEDGSFEEVAEQLMVMHEEFVKGNYGSIQKLRMSVPGTNAVSQSKKVINDDEDESSDEEDEEASDMMVDEPVKAKIVADGPMQKEMADEEGWSVVPPRRNKGKRSD